MDFLGMFFLIYFLNILFEDYFVLNMLGFYFNLSGGNLMFISIKYV